MFIFVLTVENNYLWITVIKRCKLFIIKRIK